MTKEELEQEARRYASECGDKTDGIYACCRDGYLAAAEPREQQLALLKEQRLQDCKNFNAAIEKLSRQLNQSQGQLDKAVGIIRLILRVAYGEGWDNSLVEIKELAERFLKEVDQ